MNFAKTSAVASTAAAMLFLLAVTAGLIAPCMSPAAAARPRDRQGVKPSGMGGSGPESTVRNSARAAATNRGPLAWRGRCISRGTPERNCRIANSSFRNGGMAGELTAKFCPVWRTQSECSMQREHREGGRTAPQGDV